MLSLAFPYEKMMVRKFAIPVLVAMAGVGYLAVYDADYCVSGISSALVGLLALFVLSLFVCVARRTFCLKGTDVLFALFLLVYAFYALVVDGTPFSSQRAIGWMSAGMLYYCMRRLGNRQYVFALLFGLAVVEGIYGALPWVCCVPLAFGARHRARVAVEAFYKTSPMND